MAIGDSNHKGNVAELKIAAAADLDIGVLRPMTEHGRYDLVFEIDEQLLRVQCKWGRQRGDVVIVQTGGNYHSPTRGYVRSTYSVAEIDAVAVCCGDNDTCYFLPVSEIAGMSGIHLRLAPARNGQLVGVRMAVDYELGAIAQLEERRRGTPKAAGSSPASSTDTHIGTVGAETFRSGLGAYMHRAAAGETFHVTRRGKPFVTLSPAELPGRNLPFPDLEEA